MKKILALLAVLIIATGLVAADRYIVATTTIGNDRSDGEVVVTLAALTYASTSELAFTLDSGKAYYNIGYYSSYVLEVKITYAGNPNNVNLTIGQASSTYELTGAKAIAELDSDYWVTEVIDLDTSGATSTDYYLVPDALLNGKYIYFKYQYSGDPVNDPTVELKLTRI